MQKLRSLIIALFIQNARCYNSKIFNFDMFYNRKLVGTFCIIIRKQNESEIHIRFIDYYVYPVSFYYHFLFSFLPDRCGRVNHQEPGHGNFLRSFWIDFYPGSLLNSCFCSCCFCFWPWYLLSVDNKAKMHC